MATQDPSAERTEPSRGSTSEEPAAQQVVRLEDLQETIQRLVSQAIGSTPPTSAPPGTSSSGFGVIPSARSLAGVIPTISDALGRSGSSVPSGGVVTWAASVPAVSASMPSVSLASASSILNMLPQANPSLSIPQGGVYVGEGLPPVPRKLAERIRKWEYVEMGELLPEYWYMQKEKEGGGPENSKRRPRCVKDIWSWVQCFSMYVAVIGPLHPECIPEMMAYQSTIVRISQDYPGLYWMNYDASFRKQAALSGNRLWSRINPTIYTQCLLMSGKDSKRCELCFSATHTTQKCSLYSGDQDPDIRERMKAIESLVIAMNPPRGRRPLDQFRPAGGEVRMSGEICRLWNRNACSYQRCRHMHVCSGCRGNHPLLECPSNPSARTEAGASRAAGRAPGSILRRSRSSTNPY